MLAKLKPGVTFEQLRIALYGGVHWNAEDKLYAFEAMKAGTPFHEANANVVIDYPVSDEILTTRYIERNDFERLFDIKEA